MALVFEVVGREVNIGFLGKPVTGFGLKSINVLLTFIKI